MTIFAPRAPSLSATAAPRPVAEPVTIATCPLRSIMVVAPVFVGSSLAQFSGRSMSGFLPPKGRHPEGLRGTRSHDRTCAALRQAHPSRLASLAPQGDAP